LAGAKVAAMNAFESSFQQFTAWLEMSSVVNWRNQAISLSRELLVKRSARFDALEIALLN
jgi:hypothetical protein